MGCPSRIKEVDMMVFQVVKIICIPIYCGDHPMTTEVFQPVGQRQISLEEGLELLNKFREWNKGRGITYRLIQLVEEKSLNRNMGISRSIKNE